MATKGKRRGPKPGTRQGQGQVETGFHITYDNGHQVRASRLSKVHETATRPGDCRVTTTFDGKLIATRRDGIWYDAEGQPTNPNWWYPGSTSMQRCICCGWKPPAPTRTMCAACVEAGCHPSLYCEASFDDERASA